MWKIEKIVSKGDYNYVVVKEHPKTTANGYVLEHRVVMENFLCRLLNSDEVVHHRNGNKKDNRLENLEVQNNSAHSREHTKKRGKKFVKFCCPQCKQIFVRARNLTHLQKKGMYTCCSASCRGKFSRTIQLYGRTAEVDGAISGNIVLEYTMYSSDNPEQTVLQRDA